MAYQEMTSMLPELNPPLHDGDLPHYLRQLLEQVQQPEPKAAPEPEEIVPPLDTLLPGYFFCHPDPELIDWQREPHWH